MHLLVGMTRPSLVNIWISEQSVARQMPLCQHYMERRTVHTHTNAFTEMFCVKPEMSEMVDCPLIAMY